MNISKEFEEWQTQPEERKKFVEFWRHKNKRLIENMSYEYQEILMRLEYETMVLRRNLDTLMGKIENMSYEYQEILMRLEYETMVMRRDLDALMGKKE